MLTFIKQIIKKILNIYPDWLCKREYKAQKFHRFNERPVEFGFVFLKLAEIYPLKVLDVGTGTTSLPHMINRCGFIVTAIDNVRDYWPVGMNNRHYHIIDDDITKTTLKEKFDFITCISVLEHIHNADDAIKNMFSLLNSNGHIILTFPYSEKKFVRNVYELPGSSYGQGSPYITQSFSRVDIDRWLSVNNGSIIEQEYWQFWDGEHWTVGNQLIPPKKVMVNEKHQLTCILIRKNL